MLGGFWEGQAVVVVEVSCSVVGFFFAGLPTCGKVSTISMDNANIPSFCERAIFDLLLNIVR